MSRGRVIAIMISGLTVGALAGGCGSGSSPPSAAQGSQGPAHQAYAFARCMREHGVSNFPDPQVSSSGTQTSIKQVATASVVQSPAFKTANKACAALQPGSPGSGGPSHSGPGKLVLLALARCLRAHGITDFPDPNAQGQMTQEMLHAAGVNVHAPGFFATARGCLSVTHGAITVAQLARAVNHIH